MLSARNMGNQQARPLREYREEIFAKGPCVICFEVAIEDLEYPRCSQCGNTFHVACLSGWTAEHDTCPVCRSMEGFENVELVLRAVLEPVGPPEVPLSPPRNLLPRWVQDARDAAEAVRAAEPILPGPTWSAGLEMVESEPESYLSGYEDYLAQNQADVPASSTPSLDETIVTCEQCGRRWDGNA